MEKDQRISYLYQRYLNGNLLPEEYRELKEYLSDFAYGDDFDRALDDTWNALDENQLVGLEDYKAKEIFDNILKRRKGIRWFGEYFKTLTVAASIILVSIVTILFLKKSYKSDLSEKLSLEQEILPGGNKAFLTLENGESIDLSEEKSGIKVSDAGISYVNGANIIEGKKGDNSSAYLVLNTPKGGEYQITLSDGTKVWLNAESKLKYPFKFQGKVRNVELEGEAYFEVAKSKDQPFIVQSRGQQVKVLGTHFNINTYDTETKTTLVEGKVRVDKQDQRGEKTSVILKPGEQSVVQPFASQIDVQNVNILEFLDWKDGLFVFNNESIVSIAKKLSRWYDVDFSFQGNVNNVRFSGNYLRKNTLTNLLKNIELTGSVKFKTENLKEGRRIMIIANY